MKRIGIFTVLILVPVIVFAAADVRNLSVTGNCYTAGQNVTVNFEVKCNAWQTTFGDIIFSTNSTAEYNDDAVWTSAGPQDPPDTNGHDGGMMYDNSSSSSSDWQNKKSVRPRTYT